MTRKMCLFRERNQKSPTYGHVTKLFLESEFQQKENKQIKTGEILRFSRQQQILRIKIFKYYTEKDKRKFGQNCQR